MMSNYTTVDLRTISVCKECWSLVPCNKQHAHSQWHLKHDTIEQHYGIDSPARVPGEVAPPF